jgi:hypothetical protein
MNDAHKIEPVAPTVEMWRGRPAPAKPDLIGADPIEQRQKQENNRRIEQERELEEQHRSRAVKRLPEQPRVDLVSELDSALTTLEAGAVDFEKSHGQPNSELIESRKLVAELTARLAEERAKLSEIEARGDSVTRLWNAVSLAEAQLQGLLATAETEAIKALARKHYGWDIPFSKVTREIAVSASQSFAAKAFIANDVSVWNLRAWGIKIDMEQSCIVLCNLCNAGTCRLTQA